MQLWPEGNSNPEAESRRKVCNSYISYTTCSPDAPFVVKAAELYERTEAKQIVLLHNEAWMWRIN